MRIELLVAAVLTALPGAAQPTIAAVTNNYSYNLGIAQGSIFTVFGSGLAAASSGLQAVPLQTTLDGVSVQIAVGSVTTQALLYYVMPAQIAGVLPSATPIGTGQITVTVNGQASAPAPIYVVQSAFGILQAPFPNYLSAAALDASGNLVSSTNAGNPGDTISLWGTGAGPVSGDESGPQAPLNLANIPIEVDIGGIASTVTYHGRSIYPGLDQINVEIPGGAFGCNVSVIVLSGELASNFAYLPIAAQGRTCSDGVPGIVWPPTVSLTGKLSYNVGDIEITRTVLSEGSYPNSAGVSGGAATDQFLALFEQAYNTSTDQTITFFTNAPSFPSLGSCYSDAQSFQPAPSAASASVRAKVKATTTAPGSPAFLNAGPYINFIGPDGDVAVPYSSRLQSYSESVGTGTPSPLFLPAAGGTIFMANSADGSDVGQFDVQVDASPPLVWTNLTAMPSTIDRSQSLTITWTGGDPSGIVAISAGISGANMYCVAPVSAGQFTIPASALLALPPIAFATDGGAIPTLAVTTEQTVVFSTPNLDTGFASVESQSTLWVPLQ